VAGGPEEALASGPVVHCRLPSPPGPSRACAARPAPWPGCAFRKDPELKVPEPRRVPGTSHRGAAVLHDVLERLQLPGSCQRPGRAVHRLPGGERAGLGDMPRDHYGARPRRSRSAPRISVRASWLVVHDATLRFLTQPNWASGGSRSGSPVLVVVAAALRTRTQLPDCLSLLVKPVASLCELPTNNLPCAGPHTPAPASHQPAQVPRSACVHVGLAGFNRPRLTASQAPALHHPGPP
jgi:hypothetical protein